jgi:type III pantothenate kinase
MLLVIDVGNSNTVLGLFRGRKLSKTYRVESHPESLDRLLKKLPRDIDGAIVSSVVPGLNRRLAQRIRKRFLKRPLFVGRRLKMPIRIRVKNPGEVGADRIVNATAAYLKYNVGAHRRAPLLIIDFGTATTFDLVTAKGEYIGGAISPGIGIANEALYEKCAKLPKVALRRPRHTVGRTTVDAIRAGVYFGYAGLVDGTVERIQKETGKKMRVIATGGLAPLIAPATKTIQRVDRNLTLEGLRLLYELNR